MIAKRTRENSNANHLGFHITVNYTVQMTPSCNIEHLPDNSCSVLLAVPAVFPVIEHPVVQQFCNSKQMLNVSYETAEKDG